MKYRGIREGYGGLGTERKGTDKRGKEEGKYRGRGGGVQRKDVRREAKQRYRMRG